LPSRKSNSVTKEDGMPCCGQNRAAVANKSESRPAGLRFLQRRSIVVRGPATGRRYEFHDGAYTRGIDDRDATALLKSGYFEQVPM
jgi:hypothetical protein